MTDLSQSDTLPGAVGRAADALQRGYPMLADGAFHTLESARQVAEALAREMLEAAFPLMPWEELDRYMRNPVRLRAEELKPGDALNTHADVFWDVVEVTESERYPGNLTVELVHGRKYTFAPTAIVTALR